MNQPPSKNQWVVWGGLVLLFAAIGGAAAWTRYTGNHLPLPAIGQITGFALTNQNNEPVTLADLRGKVWVADIIFSRCPGPCAKLTAKLAELQAALPANGSIRLVSLTSDPEYDTPAVLKRYADKFGARADRWWFLTGNKPEIRRLAVNDFKFVVVDKKPEEREVPEDLFIHSLWLVLVDAQGRVRGWTDREGRLHAYYDTDDSDALTQIASAAKRLLAEK